MLLFSYSYQLQKQPTSPVPLAEIWYSSELSEYCFLIDVLYRVISSQQDISMTPVMAKAGVSANGTAA